MIKKLFLFLFMLPGLSAFGQQHRDTLKLTITKIEKSIKTDTVFYFSSRVDTIALHTVSTDTSMIVKDINKQDLEESKYKISFMGSARINGYYDFAGMKSTEGFHPYDIPVGADDIAGLSSVYIGARQSRVGVEGTANTKVGRIKTYIEVDFASLNQSYLRLRHAYAEWNFWKLGYTWSTFMDNASLPQTVEFEGPNSSLSKRHGLVRYERKFNSRNIFGISLESPSSDYFNPADTAIDDALKQRNLDLATRYKYSNKKGHIQIAGILRQIDVYQEGRMEVIYGWGFLLSSTVYINNKNQINAQYSVGKGIAHYYVGFSNKQLDAVYNPGTNEMILKGISGGFINYSYRHNPSWIFSVIAGTSHIGDEAFESGEVFKSSQYYGTNILYNPIETISLGLEATTGLRKNLNTQTGNATRISMLAKFDF